MMEDIWRTTNFWGLLLLMPVIPFYFKKKIGWLLSFAWAYYLISALCVFQNTKTGFPKIAIWLDQTSGQAFCQLLVIPLSVLLLHDFYFKHWQKVFFWAGMVNAFLVFYLGYGILNANSFDVGFIATLIPLVPWWGILFLVAAVFRSFHGATGLVILMTQGAVFSWIKYPHERIKIIALGVATASAGYFLPSMHSYGSSGRLEAWNHFMSWWFNYVTDQFMGTGVGTFQWLGPTIDNLQGNLFLQMHNEWLQVLFESGFIGLAFMIASFIFLLRKASDRPKLFVSLIGTALLAFTYHPLRFFPTSLFLCCLLREILIPTDAAFKLADGEQKSVNTFLKGIKF